MIRSLLGRKKSAPGTASTAAPDTADPDNTPGSRAGEKGTPAAGGGGGAGGGVVGETSTSSKDTGEGKGGGELGGKGTKKKKEGFTVSVSKTGKNLVTSSLRQSTTPVKQTPLDVLGNVLFLQGKLKELTDHILGPDKLRLMCRGQPHDLLLKLREFLLGEDQTSAQIRRGLALSEASRHRPDIGHPMPMQALEVFESDRLAVLRMFPDAADADILKAWLKSSPEYVLASTITEFVKFLEVQSNYTRETIVARALVECLVNTCGSVLHDRHELMNKEPEMTHANMLAIATKTWSRQQQGSEAQYRQMVVKEWVETRAEDIICIMEDNVEQRSPSDEPLWGTLDYKYERLKVNTAFFNFMDFLVNFLDFAYDKGYVFKPSANPPQTWSNEEVVEWIANLRLYDYVDKVRASGVTGAALLECTKVDLECGLEITGEKEREKVWMGLETLRQTAHYESVPRLERETRGLVTLHVPNGAKGGGKMMIHDTAGKSVQIDIPERTVDRTQKMKPGMPFQIKQTYKKFVMNRWQAAKNHAVSDIGGYKGVVPPGQEVNARNRWKGAITKVKIMNLLESKVNRVLRMSQTDETVRLTAMDLSHKDAISVHDFLLVNSVCKQIELSFNNLGPRGATAIANALRDNRSVSEVRMSSCQIGDEGALELADVIRISETLQELDIGDNGLTDRSGVTLFAALAHSPPMRDSGGSKVEGTHTIRRVMLYKNNFSHQTMQAWGKCIKRHQTLLVDMTENPVGDHGVQSMAKVLTKYWQHNRLDLRTMGYGPDGLRFVALVLAKSSWRTVTSLYLSGNPIGPHGAGHLALVLENNLSLLELDLSGCSLGDDGVRMLFKAMEQNEKLEYVDLGDNSISDVGVSYVADLLQAKGQRALTRPHLYPFSLRRVVLSSNHISSEGFGVFAATVTVAHLRTIEVACCKITDNGCRVLAQYLNKNRTLKVIDLSSNLLTADGIWVIAEPLKENESLEAIRVNDNRLADSGARAVASILKFNLSIREVNLAGNGVGTKGAAVLVKVLALRLTPLEVHLHGNPCTRDAEFLALEEKLKRKNRIMTLHR